uniref:BH3-interacting domain death agonist n=1 Tax=Neogobius melanostomus TaxID=47308 RepID=A0A8C6SHV4_9GOBI
MRRGKSLLKAKLRSEEDIIQNILAHGVGLHNLQQERVIAALTFTLVKEVCLQTPTLLRSLFHTALQYLTQEGGM